ncbi:MAG: hypothetical protein B6I20_07970 [Bacteroidetes bacterium 4572_117]|nr:MAG: hypothetical protein B6I20_07970 [Bacteroidetes bacterium 4572_117]
MVFLFSCSPTKYIQESEYFLKEYKIETDNKEVLNFTIDSYVKQKPNKKIAGIFLYTRIYNLVDPVKEEKREEKRQIVEDEMNRKRLAKGKEPREKLYWTRWLRKIGEEPVIYSDLQTRNSSKQITSLLNNKGYYVAKVTDSVEFKGKKASVTYKIQSGKPYKIKSFKDSIYDENIKKLVDGYFKTKPVELNKNIVSEDLTILRNNITSLLLNNGYFKFSKEYIFFEIDTLGGDYQADITMSITDPTTTDPGGNIIESSHERYKFNDFYIYPDFEPKDLIQKANTEKKITYDTIPVKDNVYLLVGKKNAYRKSVLTRGLMVEHDSLYAADKLQSTFGYYGSLANFKLINIDFDENTTVIDTSGNDQQFLNTRIKLTPSTRQAFTIEFEGNITDNRYGLGSNLNYQHLNIFGGAEILNIQFKVELNNQDPGVAVSNSYFSETEYGVNASILFPNLISPFNTENLFKKYFPKTRFSLGYNFRYNANYRSTIFSTSFGYDWRSNELFSHVFNPVEFNLIKLKDMSPKYLNDLFETNQFTEKYDHIILGSHYSLTYSTQNIKKNRDFVFLKLTSDLAGNLLSLLRNVFNEPKLGAGTYRKDVLQTLANDKITRGIFTNQDEADQSVNEEVTLLNSTLPGFYTINGLPYAQFFKAELDFRYYHIINPENELVYRINPGVIIPFGNSYYSPQEKQFFLGGASSMRAWQARTLGPGSYSDFVQIYQYGDVKLEMNAEYRFKLFWMVDGAVFLDAGNIWTLNKYSDDPRKDFGFDKFYKEIALGTGIGFRLDASFFIIRFDFGLKLHNPALDEGQRWLNISKFQNRDWTFNFGIGYPF